MKTIRTSVFETNSSSMHCVTLMTDAEFKDFKDNDGLFNFYTNKPATWDEFYANFKADCKAESVPEDKVPTLLEFKEGMAKFECGDYDPFEDGNEDWRSMPPTNDDIDAMLNKSMVYTLQRDYCTAGYSCDWTTATTTVNGTEIMALSLYKGE